MTLPEFLKELRAIPGWVVTLSGDIRLDIGAGACDCPITAVARKRGDGFGKHLYLEVSEAARRIGLRPSTAQRIAKASDSRDIEPLLRRRLERACGIES